MRMLTVRELAHVAAMLSVLVVGVRCAGEPEGEESEHAHLTLEGGLLVAERRARAESLKVGDHLVVEVSTALIVRAAALGTPSFREAWLPTGLGLRPLSATSEPVAADFMPKSYDASGVAR